MPMPAPAMSWEEPLYAGSMWSFVISPALGIATWLGSGVPQYLDPLQFAGVWVVVSLGVGRLVARGRPCPPALLRRKLDGQTIIVTGTGSGSGYHTALQLAKQGAAVILANRSTARSEECAARMRAEASGMPLELVTTHVLELESVVSAVTFADGILAEYPRIDACIMNAGMADFAGRVVTRFHDDNTNKYEFCTAVNAVSNVVVVMKLLAVLKKSRARVVLVSSIGHGAADLFPQTVPKELRTPRQVLQFFCGEHDGDYDSWLAVEKTTQTFTYCFAKYIMVSFADYLEEKHGLEAVSLQPGSISGGFYRGMPKVVGAIMGSVGYCLTQRTAWEGAQTSLWTTLAPWSELSALAQQQGTPQNRGALYANNIQVGRRGKLALQVDPGMDAVEWLIAENLARHL
mmetsp:Transcript_8581/g.22137  ORF Transcript_8581/g.22137 Transcript_8581/m.22137 type:complete len:403 (+) Transcript_8581:59-1267(+)|eukprot:CAMPEP_0182926944 /NCGR_PEP_ID=MMETSP0105_2-20130417/12728_1 /TAXON_ID=81532 ORGANISM="Acanthoeca-like sp., Strain 10tr" /NCGR_SAMPLE_ID=MMETSP0105_2 /ASSEMBLY_ACC=CAM_ASM_000205 /LENGTH=402 /DNA_ID=CAMNT_0025064863 /DNA_START=56 /DNA_END=1264 /DNA_ORIENTATION=+